MPGMCGSKPAETKNILSSDIVVVVLEGAENSVNLVNKVKQLSS